MISRGALWAVVTLALTLALVGCETASSPTPGEPQNSLSREAQSSSSSTEALSGQAQTAIPFRRILCFGDSLTYGVTSRADKADSGWSVLAPVEGYIPKLERLLVQEYGGDFELIASGVGAETTSEGLERLSFEVRSRQPDLVLLLEGIVDVSNETPGFPGLRDNLNDMMRVVIRHDVEVIIGTYPLLDPEGWRTQWKDNVPRLNDIIRQEAKRQAVSIADHEKTFGTDMRGQGPDGLHPNDEGYEIMARTWLAQIKELAARSGT